MTRTAVLFFAVVCAGGAFGQDAEAGRSEAMAFAIGGIGGAHFLAEPGELVIEIQKRDRNRRNRPTDLRAVLVGPDRTVLGEVTLPRSGGASGGGMGPVQSAEFRVEVERTGVYALNITVAQDRYGEDIVWGFRTNCPRYLIETSRGHRDARHEEPIVLSNPEQPGDVCFMPRPGAFAVEIEGAHPEVGRIAVCDAAGAVTAELEIDADRKASHTFAAADRGPTPWRIHFPRAKATVQIDGVTRWDSGDMARDMALWTPDPASWFPLAEYRWLLAPYRLHRYGGAADAGAATFRVHNNAREAREIALALEFPGEPWPVALSTELVTVKAGAAADVALTYTVPDAGASAACHLRATPVDDAGYSTYSTLTVTAGEAPARRPLEMPVRLRPYEHENEQFGYWPEYPVDNQMYFDMNNVPYVRTSAGIARLKDGAWVETVLSDAVRRRESDFGDARIAMTSTKLAFSTDNGLYLLAMAGENRLLLHSDDGGERFDVYDIPGREGEPRTFDIEHFTGHNAHDGPPPLVRVTRTHTDTERALFWRRVCDLELFVPRMVDGRIEIGDPIMLSDKCIGISQHSGITATLISSKNRVHVIWAEATDPEEKAPGVPTFVATYDRDEGRLLGEPALIGYGAPANDVHNTPSLTIDSKGYLHAVAGTHGRPFPYAQSLEPDTAHAGWTEAVAAGEDLRQTYIGLVCDRNDTLHLVFRLWHSGVEPFPSSHYATLSHQRKRPGQPWEAPRTIIAPPFSEYSVFYHRLTIDRLGALTLSYDYWSTHWFYRNEERERRRRVITSPDGGDQWRFR